MENTFCEVKLFQVKPDKTEEFDNMENYANATHWLFEKYSKEIFKLLIMPFDINCGKSVY